MSLIKQLECFIEGLRARFIGLTIDEAPYKEKNYMANAWLFGWELIDNYLSKTPNKVDNIIDNLVDNLVDNTKLYDSSNQQSLLTNNKNTCEENNEKERNEKN